MAAPWVPLTEKQQDLFERVRAASSPSLVIAHGEEWETPDQVLMELLEEELEKGTNVLFYTDGDPRTGIVKMYLRLRFPLFGIDGGYKGGIKLVNLHQRNEPMEPSQPNTLYIVNNWRILFSQLHTFLPIPSDPSAMASTRLWITHPMKNDERFCAAIKHAFPDQMPSLRGGAWIHQLTNRTEWISMILTEDFGVFPLAELWKSFLLFKDPFSWPKWPIKELRILTRNGERLVETDPERIKELRGKYWDKKDDPV